MDIYLTCNGCGEVFHAMNYVSAFEHGSAVTVEWCGQQGFTMTDTRDGAQ